VKTAVFCVKVVNSHADCTLDHGPVRQAAVAAQGLKFLRGLSPALRTVPIQVHEYAASTSHYAWTVQHQWCTVKLMPNNVTPYYAADRRNITELVSAL
jgi:hypothetical protein